MTDTLQWGRGHQAADNIECKITGTAAYVLQWGRGHQAADNDGWGADP